MRVREEGSGPRAAEPLWAGSREGFLVSSLWGKWAVTSPITPKEAGTPGSRRQHANSTSSPIRTPRLSMLFKILNGKRFTGFKKYRCIQEMHPSYSHHINPVCPCSETGNYSYQRLVSHHWWRLCTYMQTKICILSYRGQTTHIPMPSFHLLKAWTWTRTVRQRISTQRKRG